MTAYWETVKQMFSSEKIAKTPTVWAIGAANLVSLFGVAVLNWDIFSIIILFWSETIIVYLLIIIKMATSAAYRNQRRENTKYSAIGAAILYFLSYIVISWVILISLAPPPAHTSFPIAVSPEFLSFSSFGAAFTQSAIGILAFLISHLISFFVNFLWRKEYASIEFSLMTKIPYKRFGAGKFAILIGAIVAYAINSPIPFIPVIIIKIVLDAAAHSDEHNLLTPSS